MNNSIYDIQVYVSQPERIEINNNSENQSKSNKLYDLSVENIFADEPFTNENNNKYLIYLFIFCFCFCFFLFIFKKN
jgi:hypothetical protein